MKPTPTTISKEMSRIASIRGKAMMAANAKRNGRIYRAWKDDRMTCAEIAAFPWVSLSRERVRQIVQREHNLTKKRKVTTSQVRG